MLSKLRLSAELLHSCGCPWLQSEEKGSEMAVPSLDEAVRKSPTDRRSYRIVHLPNGLTAVLVHDPDIFPAGALAGESEADARTRALDSEDKDVDDGSHDGEDGEDDDYTEDEDEEDDDEGDGDGDGGSSKKGAALNKKVTYRKSNAAIGTSQKRFDRQMFMMIVLAWKALLDGQHWRWNQSMSWDTTISEALFAILKIQSRGSVPFKLRKVQIQAFHLNGCNDKRWGRWEVEVKLLEIMAETTNEMVKAGCVTQLILQFSRCAAAALCVGMGSFSDPDKAQGLAHFLGGPLGGDAKVAVRWTPVPHQVPYGSERVRIPLVLIQFNQHHFRSRRHASSGCCGKATTVKKIAVTRCFTLHDDARCFTAPLQTAGNNVGDERAVGFSP
ncbi:hypothetical protein KSP40_PGU010729 [Platanthera guangdongensis]|uniref:Uncharacterized protein n=1 Tax=Platanthera guangdongensis TaxID=2320717 RepID=A0ABR2N4W6_9ASPA